MASPPRQRDMVIELVLTVALPSAVLMFLSDDDRLGPVWALVLALTPPLSWGVAEMVRRQRVSGIAVLALVSILLTGGVGLFELEPGWIAVKEALLPAVIGLGTILSARTRFAVLPTVLAVVLDTARVEERLAAEGTAEAWSRVLQRGTTEVGGLFLVSAVGNFALARWLVTSPAGTTAFNEELGRLTVMSLPAIMLPMMVGMAWVLRRVLDRLETLAGVQIEELLIVAPESDAS